MIFSRAPLRISIGGGGTDLPSYYLKKNGFLISAAIDKYIYITLGQTFNKKFLLKYSDFEEVNNIKKIKHPLFRETLKDLKIKTPVNISSHADIPSGSGLGSSGCFTVALIKALAEIEGKKMTKKEIAERACNIEIKKLKEPVGKQDQYSSAFGGLRSYKFMKTGEIIVKKINIKPKKLINFKNSLSIYFTGILRNSYDILKTQDQKTKIMDKDMILNLDRVKEMGMDTKYILEKGNLQDYGYLLNDHWNHKKKRSSKMTNKFINRLYDFGLNNGAIGGKLIGAGGGGFLIFFSKNSKQLDQAFKKIKINKVNFKFDFEGVKLLSL
tara:strand:+ start:5147 stop:6124 length:978 start_codon:yes stop_codon:yes gene_type:complete